MKFKDWKDMYNYISSGNDLYNVLLNKYIFPYNNGNGLCTYDIPYDEAILLAQKANKTYNYWSVFINSNEYPIEILVDSDYTTKYQSEAYLAKSYDFCKLYWDEIGWVDTRTFESEITNNGKENTIQDFKYQSNVAKIIYNRTQQLSSKLVDANIALNKCKDKIKKESITYKDYCDTTYKIKVLEQDVHDLKIKIDTLNEVLNCYF